MLLAPVPYLAPYLMRFLDLSQRALDARNPHRARIALSLIALVGQGIPMADPSDEEGRHEWRASADAPPVMVQSLDVREPPALLVASGIWEQDAVA